MLTKECHKVELGDRKKQILRAIVEDYIHTAEPIGSRTIAKRHDLSLSPATIRNEMSDLEELGFLEKPHTSAGRIPSKSGYRFYVNSLMEQYCLSKEEKARLKFALEFKMREIDDLISEASNAISRLTDYTVIASAPRAKNLTVKSIKLLPLGEKSIILAVMTSSSLLKNAGIECEAPVESDFIYALSHILSEVFTGKTPHEVSDENFKKIAELCSPYEGLYKKIISNLFDWFDSSKSKGIYAGGVFNILNHPEYKDIERAKEFIKFVDDKNNLYKIIGAGGDGISIKIGDENEDEPLKNCGVVVSDYDAGDMHGSIGIVGPMRMDYAKVVSSLQVITEKLNFLIYKMFFDE